MRSTLPKAVQHLAVLFAAGLGACSADSSGPTLSGGDVAPLASTCRGQPPPPPTCYRTFCIEGDGSWGFLPLGAGQPCSGGGQCDGAGHCIRPNIPPDDPLPPREFYLRMLGARCVDFGGTPWWAVGAPVFIYGCNGSAAQRVTIKELADRTRDVKLMVQDRFCLGVRGGQVLPGRALELQACSDTSPAQRFAVDGDAILVGMQGSGRVTREYVIEPDRGLTPNQTPLVVGTREVADAEYFRFQPVDGSSARPTSGFVRVTDEPSLDAALTRGWGTVIELGGDFSLFGTTRKLIPAGVTVRGYRKMRDPGPQLIVRADGPVHDVFVAEAPNGTTLDVRVTGFRLQGRAAVNSGAALMGGILMTGPAGARAFVDHMYLTYFTGSALGVSGLNFAETGACTPGFNQWPRAPVALIAANFTAHNIWYGMNTGNGAFAVIQGNVAYDNAHAIASDPWGETGYAAYDNLVLSPTGGSHDYDVHGSDHPEPGEGGQWYGGISGDAFDIAWNTFMPANHENFNQRGTPCRWTTFHHNVIRQSKGDAILNQSEPPERVVTEPNAFGAPDPFADLAVGDFDGDGSDDVFVGTGAAWYFSSGGQSEWRFLNRMPEHAGQLRFGDFDADGRTDAISVHGNSIDVSWAGGSPWQPLNSTIYGIADLAVGDFDGDGRADLFLANGIEWQVASRGGTWLHFADSSYRTRDLRFGDFDGDRRTDVLGVVAGMWMIVPGYGDTWSFPRPALTSSLNGLIVADFDGDGVSDLAGTVSGAWRYSSAAANPWTVLRNDTESLAGKPVGRFDGNRVFDVISWNDLQLDYAPGGRDPLVRRSWQGMR